MELLDTNLKNFNSGDTLKYYFDLKGISNLDYNVKIIFTNTTYAKREFNLINDSNLLNRFIFSLNFNDNNIIPSNYQVHLVINKNDNTIRETITIKTITINRSILNTNNDNKEHCERVLEAIEATIERRATSDHLSYSIDGKSITKMSMEDLFKFRDKYKLEVERLNNKRNNLKDTNTIKIYWMGNNYK